VDDRGNICLKLAFLHELVLAKLYIVLDQVRVVLINTTTEAILISLLEIVCAEDQL
jgi:hypothetical protein